MRPARVLLAVCLLAVVGRCTAVPLLSFPSLDLASQPSGGSQLYSNDQEPQASQQVLDTLSRCYQQLRALQHATQACTLPSAESTSSSSSTTWMVTTALLAVVSLVLAGSSWQDRRQLRKLQGLVKEREQIWQNRVAAFTTATLQLKEMVMSGGLKQAAKVRHKGECPCFRDLLLAQQSSAWVKSRRCRHQHS
jgi:hypothetical protein